MTPTRRFPTMLRKMWSGTEVQEWLDQQPTLPHGWEVHVESGAATIWSRKAGASQVFYADRDPMIHAFLVALAGGEPTEGTP